MLSIAFIGFGNSVVNYHLPYLGRQANIHVKSIFRRAEDRIGDTEREGYYPDIYFTTNLDEVMNDSEIELIVICTHADSHDYYARLALAHHKHILVEKPFASTYQEAKDIFDLAKSYNLIAMPNQNRRYDGDFLTLKKVLERGVLGDIIEIQSHYDYFQPQRAHQEFFLLYTMAVHTIDQLYSLYGAPQYIHYDVRSIYFPGETDDYIDIDFHYDTFKTTVKCSLSVKLDYPKFIVHGTKGSFIKYSSGHQSQAPKSAGATVVSFEQEDESNWGTLAYIDEEGKEHLERVPSEVTDYGLLYQQLHDAISYGKDKPIQDHEVLAVLRILEQGMTAAQNQQPQFNKIEAH